MAAPPTVAFTEANYVALIEAIAAGATQVQYGDKMVTYRSVDDLLRLRKLMCDELYPEASRDTGFAGRRSVGFFNSNK